MPHFSTIYPVMWNLSAACPRCAAPLILTHDNNFNAFICCDNHPRCRFTTGYDRLLHAMIDHILMLRDRLADLGHPVEEALP